MTNGGRTPSPEPSPAPSSDRLDSWKEIASYLKRSVRTVTRWERQEGLPVHRHVHSKTGTVYAYKPELDTWCISAKSKSVDAAKDLMTVLESPAAIGVMRSQGMQPGK